MIMVGILKGLQKVQGAFTGLYQQNLVKTIVAIIRMVGSENYGTDLRNRASHELCKRIVESGLLDDAHLPFI